MVVCIIPRWGTSLYLMINPWRWSSSSLSTILEILTLLALPHLIIYFMVGTGKRNSVRTTTNVIVVLIMMLIMKLLMMLMVLTMMMLVMLMVLTMILMMMLMLLIMLMMLMC